MPRRPPTAAVALGAGALLCAAAALYWWLGVDHSAVYTDNAGLAADAGAAAPRDVLWRAPEPLAPSLNAPADEGTPAIDPVGDAVYFSRASQAGDTDLFIARRAGSAWGPAAPLASLNTPDNELGARPSPDGAWLYFASDRPGGLGGTDLWRAPRDGDAWGAPEPLGPGINSPANELHPFPAADDFLYFASDRPAAPEGADPAGYDLYRALPGAATPAQPLTALNSPAHDTAPALSPAGDFIYFASDREGGAGGFDIHRARLVADTFATVERLDNAVNSPANELEPSVSMAGFALQFASDREGGAGGTDLYQAISREVYLQRTTRFAGLLGELLALLPWLLALLALIMLLAMLRRVATGGAWEGRFNALSLMAKCVLASLLVHALLLLALTLWHVRLDPGDAGEGGSQVRVSLASRSAGAIGAQVRAPMTEAQVLLAQVQPTPEPEPTLPDRPAPEVHAAPRTDHTAAVSESMDVAARPTEAPAQAPSPARPDPARSDASVAANPDAADPAASMPRADRRATGDDAALARADRAESAPATSPALTDAAVGEASVPSASLNPAPADLSPSSDRLALARPSTEAPAHPATAAPSTQPGVTPAHAAAPAAVSAPDAGPGDAAATEAALAAALAPAEPATAPPVRAEPAHASRATLAPDATPPPPRPVALPTHTADASSPAGPLGPATLPEAQPVAPPTPAAFTRAPAPGQADQAPPEAPLHTAAAPVATPAGPLVSAETADLPATAAITPDPLATALDAMSLVAARAEEARVSPPSAPAEGAEGQPSIDGPAWATAAATPHPDATSLAAAEAASPAAMAAIATPAPPPVAPDAADAPAQAHVAPAAQPRSADSVRLDLATADASAPTPAPPAPGQAEIGVEIPEVPVTLAAVLAPGSALPPAEARIGQTAPAAASASPMPISAAALAAVAAPTQRVDPIAGPSAPTRPIAPDTTAREAPAVADAPAVQATPDALPEAPTPALTLALAAPAPADITPAPAPEAAMQRRGARPDTGAPPDITTANSGAAAPQHHTPPAEARRAPDHLALAPAAADAIAPSLAFAPPVRAPALAPAPSLALSLPVPVAPRRRLELTGQVVDHATDAPIAAALVRMDLLEEGDQERTTGPDGAFELALDDIPDHVALTAVAEGYAPLAVNIAEGDLAGGLHVVLRLSPVTRFEVPMEDEPRVHHLGNDEYTGRINSQFQRRSEGTAIRWGFELSAAQLPPNVERAEIALLAKGAQLPNPVFVNDIRLRRTMSQSPDDGSFGEQTFWVPLELLREGRNEIEIHAIRQPGTDIDDFELVNLRLILRPPGAGEGEPF